MKNYLKKLIARKRNEMEDLKKRNAASEDVNELRQIGATLTALAEEIRDAENQLKQIEDEENRDDKEEPTTEPTEEPEEERGAEMNKRFNPIATYANRGTATPEVGTNSIEYRTAFMNYVMRNAPIPAELRADENTTTGDVGSVIPEMIVNRIIEKAETIGNILPLVTKTSYKAGIKIPTSAVKPVATFVGTVSNPTGEGLGSDKQKKTTSYISFTYHKLRCEISLSMEVETLALPIFEELFVKQVAEAMVKAKEIAIVKGNGSTEPSGILTTDVASGQTLNATAIDYALLVDAEAAIPEEYEANARWVMNKKTFMKFIGMTDENGQPIARINYGLNGKQERMLLGRTVLLDSRDLKDFTAAANEEVFAFIFNFEDYVLNQIYDMGISKKQDWDTEDLLTKAVESVDGKVVDNGSLVVVKKQVASI